MNWHRTQATILVDAGVELLAFETFPAQKEAEAVVRLLRELPLTRAWISFSCKVRCSFYYQIFYSFFHVRSFSGRFREGAQRLNFFLYFWHC